MNNQDGGLRLVAWEVTRNCNLSCVHCRASATKGPYKNEIDLQKAFHLLDQIEKIGKPIIILTGGEPLIRDDIFDIANYGDKKGFKMVMAVNGILVNDSIAKKLFDSGIKRISISLDGSSKEIHDNFRGVEGAFEGALRGIKNIKEAGIEFQINTTITKMNLKELPKLLELSDKLGAAAHHIFLLVPTGRGKYILDSLISPEEYENTLNWFYEQQQNTKLQLKATCAPQYYRLLRQRAKKEGKKVDYKTYGLDALTRGCLGGTGFCFISHTGVVQPCGFLDIDCGNIKKDPFDKIWNNSEIFLSLRNFDNLKGKCGKCEYKRVCGGCRARAYEISGDYLAQEPLCNYIP